jgi:surface antigen
MFRKFSNVALAALILIMPVQAFALQCVPYARQTSGITIHGNAKTWWSQAAGKYDRGNTPKIGAVMAFKAIRSMPIGHVATVSQIVSDREVRVDHANWSLINGRRGQIERGAKVVDVSAAGDWSQVRVWYAPSHGLGTTTYPLNGFIYNKSSK